MRILLPVQKDSFNPEAMSGTDHIGIVRSKNYGYALDIQLHTSSDFKSGVENLFKIDGNSISKIVTCFLNVENRITIKTCRLDDDEQPMVLISNVGDKIVIAFSYLDGEKVRRQRSIDVSKDVFCHGVKTLIG